MTETLTKVIVDCETGETQILPFTAEDIAAHTEMVAQSNQIIEQQEAEAAAKAAAKAAAEAKLAALGLTAEEIAAL